MASSTFRVLLKQEHGLDVHATREFRLALDTKCTIGRASKNSSKGHLMPEKHNMYIDSPVISREHAILSVKASAGAPQVFVTDTKSMHGTYVNDTELAPFVPWQLSNGDKLRFGVNVSRNENYYEAYIYTFSAELSDPEPFSRGFTVPEAESEEEELDVVQSGQGSQLHPLVLDDSDDEHAEQPDVDVDLTLATFVEQDEDEEENEDAEEDRDDLFEAGNFSEGEDASDSIADDMIGSDLESDTGSNISAVFSPEPSPVHEARHETVVKPHQWHTAEEIQETPAEQVLVDPAVREALFDYDYSDYSFMAPGGSGYEYAHPPPLPPRPSQKRQKIEATYGDEEICKAVFLEDDPSSVPSADRLQTPPRTVPARMDSPPSLPLTFESGVHIPDAVADQPPTPTSVNNLKRNADVAFDDEAEEETERKSVLSFAKGVSTSSISNVTLPEEVAVPTVEQTVHQVQRPIAQPRSILRRALHAAKVMLPATALGAVVTVTALTTLPESFFTVA
ncbi:hypothetical protein E8E13_002913 [Curvularia kusanoi]|uniref:FHA domain-containing protein n=1 Tax=Curvularia kusanoi TaxID=90978 RepID=A0A9P4T8T4_CURKU|nr:hypothetical protein E8E13_002913 [Curvularia kusanoi]